MRVVKALDSRRRFGKARRAFIAQVLGLRNAFLRTGIADVSGVVYMIATGERSLPPLSRIFGDREVEESCFGQRS